ncbi:LamG domain-containing protein [Schumannella sp. 10F1B-5-1]|uniref:LamG domain-containing protein n=1 Tax=Schumannella sp. 10F1B-5-1 TaxID=2590780 RepID=UPI00113099C5|nr:LamG domain-containing protein [Schumannella sp. 10F1B-5-1]TPW78299.1 LamG domain-containing protein [Schumannella sp. 10F1B-5-1]
MSRRLPGGGVAAAAALVLTMIAGAVVVPGVAGAFWTPTTLSGAGGAGAAATLGTGARPTVSAAGTSVTVTWAASDPADGYVVTRYAGASGGTAVAATGGCAGVVTAASCVEGATPVGTWRYTITPRYKSWVGTEGPASATVAVANADTTPPTNSFSLGSVTGAALAGSTIFYRGSAAGSFTLVNAMTDAGSGPASMSTGEILGAGFSHAQSNVAAGPPFVSAPVSWTAATTSTPMWGVDGFDQAGNRAAATFTFANDSTAPTGGAIGYADGVTSASTVAVTIAAVGDGGGSGVAKRTLQSRTATLTGTTCAAYGAWGDVVGYSGDNAFSYSPSITAGRCSQYRAVIQDAVGNQTITTSGATVKAVGRYAATVLGTSGLLSLWRLDDSGTTAADSAAGANAGAISGATTGSAGATADGNTALFFDGVDDFARVSRTIQNDFTIEFWMSSTSAGRGTGNWWNGLGLVDAETPGVQNDFGIALMGGGYVAAGTGNPDVSVTSAVKVNDGAWHHVVMTRASGVVRLYVDGTATGGSVTGSTAALTASTNIDFGRLQTGMNYYRGYLDEVAIYSRALSASEVSTHAAAR